MLAVSVTAVFKNKSPYKLVSYSQAFAIKQHHYADFIYTSSEANKV